MQAKRIAQRKRTWTAGPVRVLWSTTDWARAVADLPMGGSLPEATVIVPNERAAHALRRELLRLGHAERLVGTRFVSPFTAARETLAAAGVDYSTGEEALRPLRIRRLLHGGTTLRYFEPTRLREMPGWDEAFARTITEMEGAGWTPGELLDSGDERAADLGALWREIDAAAGTSWTAARVLREATARVSISCPLRGPVLAAVTGHESAVHAAFLCALPRLDLAVFGVRPLRDSHLQRIGVLFGPAVEDALRDARPSGTATTDRERLAANLFELREAVALTRRSASLDGTVALERYSGVEDEIDAAADWVAREVFEHKTPLEEIALLLPGIDPLAGMLVDRLARLPWKNGALPVRVEGGLPAAGSAGGTRIVAVLRALAEFLPASRVAVVLPWLRVEGENRHLSVADAMELAYALGTLGGSVSNQEGALEWKARAVARAKLLEARSNGNGKDPEEEHRRDRWKRERLLRNLNAIRASFDALVDLAEGVVRGDRLADLLESLARFLERHIRLPVFDDISVAALLAKQVREACRSDVVAGLGGIDAVAFVLATLESLRLGSGRFGDPAVYIGTIAGAAPLPFRAVRILGLAEGHFPVAEQADPVLGVERRRKPRKGVVEPPDRALTQLHAFYRVVRNAAARIVLSVPQTDVNGTEREPSALLVDVAAAIAPAGEGDDRPAGVVGLKDIERLWFAPARERRQAWRLAHPLAGAAAHDVAATASAAAASGGGDGKKGAAFVVPTGWSGAPEIDLARLLELEAELGTGPMGGLFAPKALLPVVPGTTKEAPLSPTAVRTLLECPHRFLFETLLGWEGPASPPSGLDIDALTFGSLFHRVAEIFSRRHGADFGARKRDSDHWKGLAGAIAKKEFDALLDEYPLAGPDVRAQQIKRLLSAVAAFIAYDWNGGEPRTLVDVERKFGYPGPDGKPVPFELKAGGHSLYLHGRIDRIDAEGRTTLLRDLKTGTPHPRTGREAGPLPKLDVQIALYGLVGERMAEAWGTPPQIEVAYAYVERHPARERPFREDWLLLRESALRWLDVAARLLAERSFPRTPIDKDCGCCPFGAVCGEAAPGGSMEAEAPTSGPAAEYWALRAEEA